VSAAAFRLSFAPPQSLAQQAVQQQVDIFQEMLTGPEKYLLLALVLPELPALERLPVPDLLPGLPPEFVRLALVDIRCMVSPTALCQNLEFYR
jgi:hypothetical protein